MSETTRFRDRKFCAVLYPEDPTHVAAIDKLMNGGYNFAGILHDEDVWDEGDHIGEKKKPHWHIVLKFKNAVWNEALAKELGIEPHYLQKCKSLDGALVYLVHDGFDDKYQYDLEKVFGSLKVKLASLLADTDESTRALNIYDLIRNSPGIVTYTEIFEKACRNGLYGDFRRMGAGVKWLIDEHNDEYYIALQEGESCRLSRERVDDFIKDEMKTNKHWVRRCELGCTLVKPL